MGGGGLAEGQMGGGTFRDRQTDRLTEAKRNTCRKNNSPVYLFSQKMVVCETVKNVEDIHFMLNVLKKAQAVTYRICHELTVEMKFY